MFSLSFVFAFCYFVMVFCLGFFSGYGYRKELDGKTSDDLSKLICYMDPDGSKREHGKYLRSAELKAITGGPNPR